MSKSRVLVVTPEADFGQGEFRSNEVVVLARSKSSEPSKGKGSPSKVAVKGPKPSAEMPKTPQTGKKAKSVEPEGKTSKTKANASTEVPRSVKTAKTKEKVEVSKEKARSSKQKEKSGKTPSTRSSSKRSIKTTSTKESDSKKVAKVYLANWWKITILDKVGQNTRGRGQVQGDSTIIISLVLISE